MRIIATSLLFVSLASCASRQPPPTQYVKAQPLTETPRAVAYVEVPKPMPLPGQLKRVPIPKTAKAGEKQAAWEVVDEANHKATAGPESEAFFNSIMTYDFAEGALYQVYTAPLRITSIQLQPGEKIVGKPAAGDTIRWVIGVGRSGGAAGVQQQHLYVKPTRPGLTTTIAINTDRRTYYIEVHSYEETYMAAVQWRYPHDELEQMETSAALTDAANKTITATNVNLEAANFSYRISVENGKPAWTPVQAFDDGRRTFIRFPAAMLTREAPALFVLSSTNETQLVNYRVKNDYYIVDRLADRIELRIGQKDQEIVRITRDR